MTTAATAHVGGALREPSYWRRYPVETAAETIRRGLTRTTFTARGETVDLIGFARGTRSPTVLVSPGSAGHAFVFAELAFRIHERGYNAFVMPRHGGMSVDALLRRHEAAVDHLAERFGDDVGVFGEGLGGYIVFYLALAGSRAKAVVCENSPAIMTEPAFHAALARGRGAARRRRYMLPFAPLLAKVAPRLRLPIRLHLDLAELVDTETEARRIEAPLVAAYLRDPDFDRSYPLAATLSLVSTPPPRPLSALATPTMFVVATRGILNEYEKDLFARLPPGRNRLVEVDGSVFWMCSHPTAAARLVCEWLDEVMGTTRETGVAASGARR